MGPGLLHANGPKKQRRFFLNHDEETTGIALKTDQKMIYFKS